MPFFELGVRHVVLGILKIRRSSKKRPKRGSRQVALPLIKKSLTFPRPPHNDASQNMSAPTYPHDRSSCMRKEGPIDRRFQIPGGILQYRPERDGRFPYIYKIPTHALVHSPKYIKTILIRVVDTSIKARIAQAKFEKMLSVPLGPNAHMDNNGRFPKVIFFYMFLILLWQHRSI